MGKGQMGNHRIHRREMAREEQHPIVLRMMKWGGKQLTHQRGG